MAIILVPAPATPSVLEACARKGIGRVMIQSAGFSEPGDEGKKLQDHCTAIAEQAGNASPLNAGAYSILLMSKERAREKGIILCG